MDMIGKIRRLQARDKLSEREIARKTGLSRNMVSKWLRAPVNEAPKYRRERRPNKLNAFEEMLKQALTADARRPKHERRTARALHTQIKTEGYTGGCSAVTDFIRAWRQGEGQAANVTAYVPLSFELGEAFQFDWSEEGLVVGGIYHRAQVAHLKLCASRAFWLVAYPSQGHEMLFDAHTRSFAALGGVARRGIYDNMRTAVDKVHKGKGRTVNARFAVMCAHNVQLLRGPDAVFLGSGQPSGAMNLVRKKPLAEPHLKYRVSAGSWNNYQGDVDVTGKIAETGNLRGRLVAAYNDRQYFFGGADRQLSTLHGSRTREQGAYANARFELGRGWSTTLGGRYSRIRIQRPGGSTWDSDGQPYIATNQSSGNFIPFYALAYELSPHWSAYFTVARSFEDQSNYYTESGRPLSHTTGRSFELGVKGEHWDGLLQTNLTVYRSRRDNFVVRVSDPSGFDVPGRSCCYSGDGRFLAQGIEAEVSGKLAQGWQVNAGYTYDDNETSYGASDGTRYASYTPKHIFKLASRYDLWGSLAGWTVGGGVRAQSSFFKSGTVGTWNPTGGRDGAGAFDGPAVAYRFTEPGRAVWNLFVEHRLSKSLTLALNINNLFDKRYFSAVGNTAGGNIFGEPRSVGLTLRGQL